MNSDVPAALYKSGASPAGFDAVMAAHAGSIRIGSTATMVSATGALRPEIAVSSGANVL